MAVAEAGKAESKAAAKAGWKATKAAEEANEEEKEEERGIAALHNLCARPLSLVVGACSTIPTRR